MLSRFKNLAVGHSRRAIGGRSGSLAGRRATRVWIAGTDRAARLVAAWGIGCGRRPIADLIGSGVPALAAGAWAWTLLWLRWARLLLSESNAADEQGGSRKDSHFSEHYVLLGIGPAPLPATRQKCAVANEVPGTQTNCKSARDTKRIVAMTVAGGMNYQQQSLRVLEPVHGVS